MILAHHLNTVIGRKKLSQLLHLKVLINSMAAKDYSGKIMLEVKKPQIR